MNVWRFHAVQVFKTVYDANFKLVVFMYSKETNNCGASRRYSQHW